MASNKNRRRRSGTAHRDRRRTAFIAAAAVLAIAAIVAIGLGRRAGKAPSPTPTSPTTLWPYGQPEYFIEIPEGYEDLLPGEKASPDPARVREEAPQTESARPPAELGEKAEPYILTVRKKMVKEGNKPTLIIVIDDVGYNLDQLKPFLELPFPLSIAVLPQVDHSAEAAKLSAKAGKEVLLHQPMQSLGGDNPGPGAILLDMPREEAAATLNRNIESLPQAVGLNNHMGSAVTRNAALMRSILDLAKKRGIYYLDSLTAPDTATAALCRELNIPYWERDVFLDNTGDKQSILHALEEGKKAASARGASVLIGHVWSSELAQTLMDIYPQLIEEGYSLSTISRYMIRSATGETDARSGD